MESQNFKIIHSSSKPQSQKQNKDDPYSDSHAEAVDPGFMNSLRSSLAHFSFVSETDAPAPAPRVNQQLAEFYVMSRMQWIQCLKILFDQLLQVTTQNLVEKQNFHLAVIQTKDLLPLMQKGEYMKNHSEVSYSLKEVCQQIESMPDFITCDNIIDIFVNPTKLQQNSAQVSKPGQSQNEKFNEYVLSFADSMVKPQTSAAPVVKQYLEGRYAAISDDDEVECEIDDDDDDSSRVQMGAPNVVVQQQSPVQNTKFKVETHPGLDIFSKEAIKVNESQATGTFRNTHTQDPQVISVPAKFGGGQQSPRFQQSPNQDLDQYEENKSTGHETGSSSNKFHGRARIIGGVLSNSSGGYGGMNDSLAQYSDASSNNTTGWIDKDLSSLGLTSFGFDFGSDKKCIRINLANNAIMKIDGIKDRNVLVINLSNNNLKSLSGLTTCVNLKFLNLSSNHLDSLAGINNLKKLDELYLSYNILRRIREINNLQRLRILDCSYNKLLDAQNIVLLSELKNLKVTSFIGNPMTKNDEYIRVCQYELSKIGCIDPQDIRQYSNMMPMHQTMCFSDINQNMKSNQSFISSATKKSDLVEQSLRIKQEFNSASKKKVQQTNEKVGNQSARNAYQLYQASASINKPKATLKTKEASFQAIKRPATSTSFRQEKGTSNSFYASQQTDNKNGRKSPIQSRLLSGRVTPTRPRQVPQMKLQRPVTPTKSKQMHSPRRSKTPDRSQERSVSPMSTYMKRSVYNPKLPPSVQTTKAALGKKFDFGGQNQANAIPSTRNVAKPSKQVAGQVQKKVLGVKVTHVKPPALIKEKSDSVSPIRDETSTRKGFVHRSRK